KGPFALNQRDHRKILIADDKVAVVGGVNLATTYESAPPIAHALGGNKQPPAKAAHPVWHDVDLEIAGRSCPSCRGSFASTGASRRVRRCRWKHPRSR